MATQVQERNFCSRLWTATCHEAKFRWNKDKCGLYLFAIGIILASSFLVMVNHSSFASCMTWNYYMTNPAILVVGISIAGTIPATVGYGGYLLLRIYEKTMHPEIMATPVIS
jgi:hypothetical protein